MLSNSLVLRRENQRERAAPSTQCLSSLVRGLYSRVNSSTRELNSSQSSSPMMRVREVQKCLAAFNDGGLLVTLLIPV